MSPEPRTRPPLDAFERAALEFLCAGEHPVLRTLRAQLAAASLRAREEGPHGRMSDLWIPDGPPRVEHAERFALDDVLARIEGLDGDVQLLLHVHRGRMATLEVSAIGTPWAGPPDRWTLAYAAPAASEGGQLAEVDDRNLGFALRGWKPGDSPA